MPDIFDEIDEDLRAERAQQLLKRYAWVIVAAALLIVGAAAGWQGWRWLEAKRTDAAATEFLAAMRLADGIRPGSEAAARPQAIADFDKLAASAPAGYRTLARLREAGLKADSGDLAGAAVAWDQVAGDPAVDPLLRDLASLLWVQHYLDHGVPGLLEARLKPLESPENPWHSLAEETQAVLDLRQGRTEEARAAFRRLAQDPAAPDGVRGRAGSLLSQLGG